VAAKSSGQLRLVASGQIDVVVFQFLAGCDDAADRPRPGGLARSRGIPQVAGVSRIAVRQSWTARCRSARIAVGGACTGVDGVSTGFFGGYCWRPGLPARSQQPGA